MDQKLGFGPGSGILKIGIPTDPDPIILCWICQQGSHLPIIIFSPDVVWAEPEDCEFSSQLSSWRQVNSQASGVTLFLVNI